MSDAISINTKSPVISVSAAKTLALRIAFLVAFLAIWQGLVSAGVLDEFFFGSPLGIARRLIELTLSGQAVIDLWVTFVEAMLGFGFGLILGVLGAVLLFEVKWLSAMTMPYLSALNALPRVLLAPIFIIWFGIGLASKVVLVVSVVSLVTFFATYSGLQSVDAKLLAAIRVLGADGRQLRRYILIPSATAWLFSSLRVSVGFAFTSAVVGEYLGANKGIGYLISQAQGVFDTNGAFAGLAIVMVTAMIILAAVGRIEKYLLRWR